jgi:hypothetical protein
MPSSFDIGTAIFYLYFGNVFSLFSVLSKFQALLDSRKWQKADFGRWGAYVTGNDLTCSLLESDFISESIKFFVRILPLRSSLTFFGWIFPQSPDVWGIKEVN